MTPFYDYFIRCSEADVDELMALTQQLGVLRAEGDGFVTTDPAWVWVPIGRIQQDGAPVLASDGQPAWHANLRLTMDLLEHAQAAHAASPSPELAAGLANVGRFFVVDENGRATRPNAPAVVFL